MAAAAAKAAAAALSAAAATALSSERAHAEGGGTFRFPGFSSSIPPAASPPTPTPPQPSPAPAAEEAPRVRNDNPRTTAAGFDPEALERGVEALHKIEISHQAKKLFELMKKREETRQAEVVAKKTEYEREMAALQLEKTHVDYEEKKKLEQARAQIKAQIARYEDELARKRQQAEHEAQRMRNQELVKMQEESAIKQEQMRRAIEEEIQAQRRQTAEEKAKIERETMKLRALAEAEARAHEAKLSEDVNRRLLVERANAEREKWVQAINTTFEHIGGGLRTILTDKNKLVVAVGGATALAAGIYTTR